MKVTILHAGFLTTVQDRGRHGHSGSGVSVGGALDAHAIAVANLLVGNGEDFAGLELTLGTVRLRFADPRIVAWCGGGFHVRIGASELRPGYAARVDAGEEISLSAPEAGARAWLAISGGIDVPLVLGSRSTDLRGCFGGFNGRALSDGDELNLGRLPQTAMRIADSLGETRIASWTASAEWTTLANRPPTLRFVRGTEWPRLDPDAQAALLTQPFTVSVESDRMGARLKGPALRLSNRAELISEGVVPGTLQLPPDGQAILLLGDCQSLGGYPKIAHVITVDLPLAAQLWPDVAVRFLEVPLPLAHQLRADRANDLARFKLGRDLRLG